jgi:hypothetical protein
VTCCKRKYESKPEMNARSRKRRRDRRIELE